MARFSKFTFLLILLASLLAPVSSWAESADDLLAAGRVDDAIRQLQATVQSNSNDGAAYNLLCRAYFSLSQWDRSINACEKAVAADPGNGLYHLWLGRAYGEKADSSSFVTAAFLAKKVRSEFETAVRLSPDNVDAHADLAEFYLEAPGVVGGGRDKAEAQARTLDKLDPAKALYVKGRIAEKNKDTAAAERDYRDAIEASHGSANAWLNLALFFRHQQRLDDMEDALNHAASAQMSEGILMEAAEMLIRAGRNFPAAIQMLERYLSHSTVEAAPAFKAHYLLGTVFEKQGDKQAAEQQYRAALSMAKDFSRAQEGLSRVTR
ncbi:MAG TPA: tetratricopeptide repeat protein [Terriglobales bacterium]|nr:tetratricopeptide repeat protein [Terriglobales bacterium]